MKNNIVINIVASVFSFFGSILFFLAASCVSQEADRQIYLSGRYETGI